MVARWLPSAVDSAGSIASRKQPGQPVSISPKFQSSCGACVCGSDRIWRRPRTTRSTLLAKPPSFLKSNTLWNCSSPCALFGSGRKVYRNGQSSAHCLRIMSYFYPTRTTAAEALCTPLGRRTNQHIRASVACAHNWDRPPGRSSSIAINQPRLTQPPPRLAQG